MAAKKNIEEHPGNGYRVLGTTDDVTTCECCGRADLKGTVALQWTLDGEDVGGPVFFGCVCAARAVGEPAKAIKAAAKSADDEKAARVQRARDRLHAARMTLCETHLNAAAAEHGIPARLAYADKLWALADKLGVVGFEAMRVTGFVEPVLKLEDFLEV
jgi:hypothetical protein